MFFYSNLGYVLLGWLFIERVFNIMFEIWIYDVILGVFEMKNIGFEIILEIERNMVFFYENKK